MATRRRGKLLAGFGVLLGIWTTSAGCQSLKLPSANSGTATAPPIAIQPRFRGGAPDGHDVVPAAASAAAQPIEPRHEYAWLVEADQIQPSHRMAGTGVVGPDGTLEIGPYGSVRVAGLTTEQASIAIRHYLANYLAHPRVRIEPAVPATAAVQTVAWHTTSTDTPAEAPASGTSSWRPVQREGNLPEGIVTTGTWKSQVPTVDAGPVAQPAVAIQPATASEPPANDTEIAPPPKTVVDAVPAQPLEHISPIAPVVGPPPVPRELAKVTLPRYVIEPPDILLVESTAALKLDQPVRGQHLVRPDGTIGLGIYGSVRVAGLNVDQARQAVADLLKQRITEVDVKNISVDVLAYNSKFYYVITDGGGYGEQVIRIPVTGNETVLDAISLINGLSAVSSRHHIWVARRTPGDFGTEKILPVDWIGITQRGSAATNYQIMPGDRVYVKADKWRSFDAKVAKIISPFERMLGVTLLGSETVNSIKNGGATGTVH